MPEYFPYKNQFIIYNGIEFIAIYTGNKIDLISIFDSSSFNFLIYCPILLLKKTF